MSDHGGGDRRQIESQRGRGAYPVFLQQWEVSMEVREIQERAADFVRESQLEAPMTARVLDLVSEVGEVAKEVLESSEYGRAAFHPGPSWREELGDAFFSLVCVANSSGIDLEQCLLEALARYGARLRERGDAGSGS
jgi:NTP pyrophosphatase (non-canonical NTP hydrolase)